MDLYESVDDGDHWDEDKFSTWICQCFYDPETKEFEVCLDWMEREHCPNPGEGCDSPHCDQTVAHDLQQIWAEATGPTLIEAFGTALERFRAVEECVIGHGHDLAGSWADSALKIIRDARATYAKNVRNVLTKD